MNALLIDFGSTWTKLRAVTLDPVGVVACPQGAWSKNGNAMFMQPHGSRNSASHRAVHGAEPAL